MVQEILTDNFKKVCIANTNLDTNKQVMQDVIDTLAMNKSGFTLSCNQIGVFDHRVCVINVIELLVLINPVILELKNPIEYIENSISYPNKMIKTIRYSYIKLTCDNYEGELEFGYPELTEIDSTDLNLLETVFIQHAIDMLDGKDMFDVSTVIQPIEKGTEIRRNQFVELYNETTNETIKIKYKKAKSKLNNGWIIKN